MSDQEDWSIINVPGILARRVRTYDASGVEVPDDGEWHRRSCEAAFVAAEFLAARELVRPGVGVSRRSDLVIRRSDLTAEGEAFVRMHYDAWLGSLDRRRQRDPSAETDATGLERRWKRFSGEGQQNR